MQNKSQRFSTSLQVSCAVFVTHTNLSSRPNWTSALARLQRLVAGFSSPNACISIRILPTLSRADTSGGNHALAASIVHGGIGGGSLLREGCSKSRTSALHRCFILSLDLQESVISRNDREDCTISLLGLYQSTCIVYASATLFWHSRTCCGSFVEPHLCKESCAGSGFSNTGRHLCSIVLHWGG